LYSRHYSSKKNGSTKEDWLRHGITSSGESITLLTTDSLALFVWLKMRFRADKQEGVNCAVFRNEGPVLSSKLILEAETIASYKWPNERLFTFVDPVEVNGDGFCFKCAGWCKLKNKTKNGKIILEKKGY